MKNKFSTHWNSSKQPRKQRKYLANAPLHIKKKFVSMNLSKELRKKYGKRNVPARKGDTVKIFRGKFKGKQGKITEIKLKSGKIIVENIQTKKQDGSKANVAMKPSKLQITELNTEDKKRFGGKEKQTEKPEAKTEEIKYQTKIKQKGDKKNAPEKTPSSE